MSARSNLEFLLVEIGGRARIGKPPIAAIGAVAPGLLRLHLADQGDQRLARGFAFVRPVAHRHCEGVAAGWDPPARSWVIASIRRVASSSLCSPEP